MCGSAGGHHVSPACVPRLQVGPEDEGACCAIGSGDQGAGGVIISMEQGSLKGLAHIHILVFEPLVYHLLFFNYFVFQLLRIPNTV